MFIRFNVIHERDGQTDRRTPGLSIYRAYAYASRGNNWEWLMISSDASRLADKFFQVAIVYLQMPTSVPKFNFLVQLVSEIWGESQNKEWELLISPDAPWRTNFYTER